MRKYNSLFIYNFSKQFPNEFMALVATFKSSSKHRDVHFVNQWPTYSKIDDEAGCALECGYLVIDKLLRHTLRFSIRSNQHPSQLLPKYGPFQLLKKQDGDSFVVKLNASKQQSTNQRVTSLWVYTWSKYQPSSFKPSPAVFTMLLSSTDRFHWLFCFLFFSFFFSRM